MSRTPKEQLIHFLSDMYSVEQQALAQLAPAPDIAGDPKLAAAFRQHHEETEHQAELVRERLEAHGGSPSAIKDAVMKLGGKGFLLFAQVQPETPGRLIDHAYAYEAMEFAGYAMLVGFAELAGDRRTIEVAKQIGTEERAMMERLEREFDTAEQVSHGITPSDELPFHVAKHLAEAHAFESQGIQLFQKSEEIGGNSTLTTLYRELLSQTRRHAQLVEQRLEALGSATSTLKDAALATGGVNWGLFFQAQSDTPAKLAAFVYAFLHLEIGGYELLKRTARRADDEQTRLSCETILGEKRQMTHNLADVFAHAVQFTSVQLAGN
ncbi:MAG: DUF892 family protein [Planctomycetaceae bacterium]|nr:DUF892 family protein [Planctomycetaceae bacterium]